MEQYKRVRGMHDIMPEETARWHYAEKVMGDIVRLFSYKEIRVPLVEERSLFERSIGAESDIISKEMYAFQDKKGRNLALRPEGTAPVVRAFIESGASSVKKVTRLYYYGPMFRYDRPQKGRYRQFYQFGVELMGGSSPFFDGEVIEILDAIIKRLNIGNCYFGINTLGCKACKVKYAEKIKTYLDSVSEDLCPDCKKRVHTAPLRILDCKNSKCREAVKNIPSIREVLCEDCRIHFDAVIKYLDEAKIPYRVHPNLVRGLDYYTRTVFEVYLREEESAVAAGGRYDNLVKEMGGDDTPAVGFAIGMERLIPLIQARLTESPVIYCICMGREAKIKGTDIARGLRKEGVAVEVDYEERALKTYLKIADRENIEWCMIMGGRELEAKTVIFKNMLTGVQEEINMDVCIQVIRDRINKS